MKSKEMAAKLLETFKKYKYIILIIIVGMLVMMIPSKSTAGKAQEDTCEAYEDFSLDKEERRLEEILSTADGAGEVKVMLSLSTGTEQVPASDSEKSTQQDEETSVCEEKTETVILSKGSGTEAAVITKRIYPKYKGAVIVAEGAGNAKVKWELTEAVSALTGLSTEKISVIKMQER